MKAVSRNEYFDLIRKLGVKQTKNEYKIADLDLSIYPLNEDTKRIANVNFMKETENRNGYQIYVISLHRNANLI